MESSFFLYEGFQEWKIKEPRDCFELGHAGCNVTKQSREIEFSVRLSEGNKSCPILWHTSLLCNSGERVDTKPAFKVSVYTKTRGESIGRNVGLKCAVKMVEGTSNGVIEGRRSYSYLKGNAPINSTSVCWLIELGKIPLECPSIKLIVTYQVCDPNDVISARPFMAQPQEALPIEDQQRYCMQLAHALAKDCQEGYGTDVILKLDDVEYKAHKLVLAVQLDFFKAKFSDHWKGTEKINEVDMNDSELNPEILGALISGAYTGKVESVEMALKLLPATDKYQFTKLKEICEAMIACQLTRDNVLDVYLLAKECNAQTLQMQCGFLIKP